MAQSLAKGSIILSADDSQLQKGLKDAAAKIQGFSTSLGGGVSFFSTGPMGAAVAGLKLAVSWAQELGRQISEAGDRAEKTLNASETFNIGTDDFQALAFGIKQAGGEVETLERGFKQLSDVVVSAAMGQEDAVKKLQTLGLKPEDFTGKGTIETLDLVGKKINELPKGLQQVKAASDIFGKSALGMMPFLRTNIGKDVAGTKASGMLLTDDELQRLATAGDAIDKLGASFVGLKDKLLSEVAPAAEAAAGALSGVTDGISKAVTETGDRVRGGYGFMEAALDFFDSGTGIEDNIDKALAIQKKLRAQEQKDKQAGNNLIDNAVMEAQRKEAAKQQEAVDKLKSENMALMDSFRSIGSGVSDYAKGLEKLTGAAREAAKEQLALKASLDAAKPLIQQSPFDALAMQMQGLDALMKNGSITSAQFFQAAAKAGQGIIGAAGLSASQVQLPSAIMRGSQEDINATIRAGVDMAPETQTQLLERSAKAIEEQTRKQESQGQEMIGLLRKLVDKRPVELEAR